MLLKDAEQFAKCVQVSLAFRFQICWFCAFGDELAGCTPNIGLRSSLVLESEGCGMPVAISEALTSLDRSQLEAPRNMDVAK
eukprot:508613-Amphidinium_carterae.1